MVVVVVVAESVAAVAVVVVVLVAGLCIRKGLCMCIYNRFIRMRVCISCVSPCLDLFQYMSGSCFD